MGKYMFIASYETEGVKGLISEGGTGRRKAVDELAASMGGSIEAMYYAFGDDDVFVIADLPDAESAASLALSAGASGSVSIKTVVLLTPEQVDAATQKSPAYRPPGG